MNFLNQSYASIEELKQHFRELARKFHPDLNPGATGEEMKELNKELECLISIYKTKAKSENKEQRYSAAEEFDFEQDILSKLIEISVLKLEKVDVEVIGNWIWLSGNTRDRKDEIKGIGFYFAKTKKAWYWHADNFRKKSRKTHSMETLRAYYGSQVVDVEEVKRKVIAN